MSVFFIFFLFLFCVREGFSFCSLKSKFFRTGRHFFFFLQAVIDVRFFSVNISQNGMVLDSLKQGKIPLKKKLELGR